MLSAENLRPSPLVEKVFSHFSLEYQTNPQLWSNHILPTYEEGKKLCLEYPEADTEMVLSAILGHDLSKAHFSKWVDHETYGAEAVQAILQELGVAPDRVNLAYQACLSHECRRLMPSSLEAELVATADGIGHFRKRFYWHLYEELSMYIGGNKAAQKVLAKLNHDYYVKIHPEKNRQELKSSYRFWRAVFNILSKV